MLEAERQPINQRGRYSHHFAIEADSIKTVCRWRFETHVGLFWGLHSTLTKYMVGNSRTRYNGWTTGIGSSVGYSWVLAKRWNLTLEGGIGIYYYMDDLRWHPDPSPLKAIRYEHCRRVVLAPSKIEVAFSYLF